MFNIFGITKQLSNSRKKSHRQFIGSFISLVPTRKNLKLLARIYGTDKQEHGYIEFYQNHFGSLRRKKLNILVICVGGYKDPESGGEPLRMWQDYFSNSMIYSIGIFDKKSQEDKRIKIFKVTKMTSTFLRELQRK